MIQGELHQAYGLFRLFPADCVAQRLREGIDQGAFLLPEGVILATRRRLPIEHLDRPTPHALHNDVARLPPGGLLKRRGDVCAIVKADPNAGNVRIPPGLGNETRRLREHLLEGGVGPHGPGHMVQAGNLLDSLTQGIHHPIEGGGEAGKLIAAANGNRDRKIAGATDAPDDVAQARNACQNEPFQQDQDHHAAAQPRRPEQQDQITGRKATPGIDLARAVNLENRTGLAVDVRQRHVSRDLLVALWNGDNRKRAPHTTPGCKPGRQWRVVESAHRKRQVGYRRETLHFDVVQIAAHDQRTTRRTRAGGGQDGPGGDEHQSLRQWEDSLHAGSGVGIPQKRMPGRKRPAKSCRYRHLLLRCEVEGLRGDDAAGRMHEEHEVQPDVGEPLVGQVRLDVGRIAILDEGVGVVPTGVVERAAAHLGKRVDDGIPRPLDIALRGLHLRVRDTAKQDALRRDVQYRNQADERQPDEQQRLLAQRHPVALIQWTRASRRREFGRMTLPAHGWNPVPLRSTRKPLSLPQPLRNRGVAHLRPGRMPLSVRRLSIERKTPCKFVSTLRASEPRMG